MRSNERTDEQYRELIDAIRAGHDPSRLEILAIADWADSRDHERYRFDLSTLGKPAPQEPDLDAAFDRLKTAIAALEVERTKMLDEDVWRTDPLTARDLMGEEPDSNRTLGLSQAVAP